MFKGNLAKNRPLCGEFWSEKPTHMGGTYLYSQHAMFPPPGYSVIGDEVNSGDIKSVKTRKSVLFVALVLLLFWKKDQSN